MGYYPANCTQSKTMQLSYPHYSDQRWNSPQLIYGKECKVQNIEYSDRLWERNWKKAADAADQCKDEGLQPRTVVWIERWLSIYHDRAVVVKFVHGGCNVSSGYEYYIYGYNFKGVAA